MNRRLVGLAALVVGAGAVVRQRMRTQADPGPASEHARAQVNESDPAAIRPSPGSPASSTPIDSESEPTETVADGPGTHPDTAGSSGMQDDSSPAENLDVELASMVDAAPLAVDDIPASDPVATIVLPTMPRAGTRLHANADAIAKAAMAVPRISIPSAVEASLAPAAAEPAMAQPPAGPDTVESSPVPSSFAPDLNAGVQKMVPVIEPAPPRDSDQAKGPAVPRRQRRGWRIFGGLFAGLLIAAFIAASAIRLPYYSLKPGAVYDTIERVEAPGDMVTLPNGEIGFVTVAQTANITPWQWLDAKLDSNVRIRHEDEVRGDQSADELREADLRRMQVSKNSAVVVALQRLGFDLEITPIGIEVAQVFDCTAADGTLGTGDLIVGVNGQDVRDGEQLVEQLAGLEIGADIELLVERIDPTNPTQSMRTDLVGLTLGSADAACLPDDIRSAEARPFIGIGTLTIVDENFPVDVDLRTGQVSGPSAGLAFTLAIIDVLSEGELTNGLSIVATGTIDRDGNVGPVGGIQQKTVAAERSGADVFLVPMCCDNFVDSTTGEPLDLPSNYEEALLYADDMIVVGVGNLDDALIAIGKLGGDVDRFLSQ